MATTTMPVIDWNPLDQVWEEYRYAGMDLETKKIISYRTSKSTTKIIMWDDWDMSFTEILQRSLKRNTLPIAVGKSEVTGVLPDEFFIITNDTDALQAILMFQ